MYNNNAKLKLARNNIITGLLISGTEGRLIQHLFTTFPEPVLALTQLENLDISGNNLRHLPLELQNFSNLKILVLINNHWENPADVESVSKALASQGTIIHQ